MAFIVIGPGIHDPINVDPLFGRRPVAKVGSLSPRPRIEPHGPVDVGGRYAELLLRRERGEASNAYQQFEALHEKKSGCGHTTDHVIAGGGADAAGDCG